MARAGKAASAVNTTPGRRKKTQDQYFEPGKIGRKTGITLKDTGIRDEHGLEPVSGIFSSPAPSPQRHGETTLSSGDMQLQDSSAPEVERTLLERKTPRMPPPRASTPKHTNLGSPKRMSSTRSQPRGRSLAMDDNLGRAMSRDAPKTQPANRILDFESVGVHQSIEITSPFKPKKVLRRSNGSTRADPSLSIPTEDDDEEVQIIIDGTVVNGGELQDEVDVTHPTDDGPLLLDDDDEISQMVSELPSPALNGTVADEQQQTPSLQSRSDRARASESGGHSESRLISPVADMTPTPSKKRDRASMEDVQNDDESETGSARIRRTETSPAQKKSRGKPPREVVVHREDPEETIDPALLSRDDQYVADDASDEPTQPPAQAPTKGKGKKAKAAPKERDPNRTMKAPGSPLKLNGALSKASQSPSKTGGGRGVSMGPVSNVNLRSTTPFDDAGGRTSRFGRTLTQPLKYWASESRVWRNGEIEGIIRADAVEQPKPGGKKGKKKRAKKASKGVVQLEDIDEESGSESILPDEWEEDVGVIAGNVATYVAETQFGNPEELVREDLAFACSSIVTRDVANGEFKYAKVLTSPFFGSGVVEIPPSGYKRAKNSRKMQMAFFVHAGKVMVDVGAQGGSETNQFAISKGGMWVVPRGNNYAITNESSSTTARIFFAQGCEVDAVAQ